MAGGLCSNRLSEMGDDLLHGCRGNSDGLYLRAGERGRARFFPQRFHPFVSSPKLLIDGAQTVYSIAKEKLEIPRETLFAIPNGTAAVVKVEGEKVGVYKTPDGGAYCVTVRCPHLGCRLEWNPAELSWDCPCHGSRFDYTGKLLNDPAQTGIEKAER